MAQRDPSAGRGEAVCEYPTDSGPADYPLRVDRRPVVVVVVVVAGHPVLRIVVPRAGRQAKPVHQGSNPLAGTCLRRHEGDYPADDEAVRCMLAERVEGSRDERILKNFDLGDLDSGTVASCRNRFAAVKPGHVWTEPMKTIADPACGTGGFFGRASNGLTRPGQTLNQRQAACLNSSSFYGNDIVPGTRRLCLMNLGCQRRDVWTTTSNKPVATKLPRTAPLRVCRCCRPLERRPGAGPVKQAQRASNKGFTAACCNCRLTQDKA